MHQSSVSRHGTLRIVTPGTGVAADSAEYGIPYLDKIRARLVVVTRPAAYRPTMAMTQLYSCSFKSIPNAHCNLLIAVTML